MTTDREDAEQLNKMYEKSVEALQGFSMQEETQNLEPRVLKAAHRKGVVNQVIVVGAVWFTCIAAGLPIGMIVVLLSQMLGPGAANIPNQFPIDIDMGTWIASISILATPFGSFLSGPMADFLGRRNTLIIALVPMFTSSCIIALSQSFPVMLVGRLISGLSIGILGGPIQIYIAEVTEPRLRGLLISFTSMMFSTGITIVYTLGASFHWRVVSWISGVLSIMAIIAVCLIPESPTWLLRHNKEQKALKALKILRGHATIAEDELREMRKRVQAEKDISTKKENIFQLCSQPNTYKPLMIVTVFACVQLLTGTFILINYANKFVDEIGAKMDASTTVIATGVARNLCSFVFCGIALVVPIRTISLATGVSSSMISLFVSIYLYANGDKEMSSTERNMILGCFLLYILFNSALMIVSGVLLGELLPAKVRGRCTGLVFTLMNVLLFLIIKWFPYIQILFKLRGVFLMFTVSNVSLTLFVYLFQPNTNGRTLDEIEDYFKQDNWLWTRRDRNYKKVNQSNVPIERRA